MRSFHWLEKLLLFASGTDEEVLSQCSSAERSKYTLLGGLTFIPIATSAVALLCISSYYTRNPLAVAAVCLGWGCVVFLIERSIIASLRPGEHSLAVYARIVLALAMSAIITEPLIVFAFREDINEVIAKRQMAERSGVEEIWNERINGIRADLEVRKAALDAKQKAYLDEIDGRNGTGIHGYGPSAKAKEAAYLLEKREYDEAKTRLQAEISEARQSRSASVGELAGTQRRGLLRSIATLYEMAGEDPTVLRVLIIMHLYFLLVELLPLIVKRNYKGSQYYDVMDAIDAAQIEAVKLTLDDRREMLRLAGSFDLEMKRLELEKNLAIRQMDSAGEKALSLSRSLVKTYVDLSEVESEAYARVPALSLADLKRELDTVLDQYIVASKAVINPY